MSTRTQRQSSLLSLSEVKQIVDDVSLGQVDPTQVAQVAPKHHVRSEGYLMPVACGARLRCSATRALAFGSNTTQNRWSAP